MAVQTNWDAWKALEAEWGLDGDYEWAIQGGQVHLLVDGEWKATGLTDLPQPPSTHVAPSDPESERLAKFRAAAESARIAASGRQ